MKSNMRLVCIVLAGAVAMAQEVCAPTPLYSVCDLVFDAPRDGVTQLRAEVKSPKFKTALIDAFYDDARRWVIRFAPVDAGQYEFRLTSNLAQYNGKVGTAEAVASSHPGFIRPANVHHWIHPETIRPHLWTGSVNHTRVRLNAADSPAELRAVEKQIRDANAGGKIADLVLAPTTAEIVAKFPTWRDRERWLRMILSRFAAFDITWLLVERFEGPINARPLLTEMGAFVKANDPYNHPRSAGTGSSSSALLADGWMDYVNIGLDDDALPSVEHQFLGRPFVSMTKARTGTAFRAQLWNATMSGQYPSFEGGDPETLRVWHEFFSKTRFWELEPFFDLDGGRALALDEIEYIVYIEKPSGPVEVNVVKHGYDVYWIDPATGQATKAKEYKGEHFVGEPPSRDHDWVLHLSRDGKKAGMLKSYKFESRQNLGQEIEQNNPKVPFEVAEPAVEEISLAKPPRFALKLKRETRATRAMQIVWTGEVVADGQGARVLGTGTNGVMKLTPDIATKFPAVFNVRVSAINANGKAYSLDRVYRLVP